LKITHLLDRPIAFHRCFVTLTGSVKAAIMLSQAIYWQPRAKQEDGWWYKTAEEWQEETGLSQHEQRTARKDCGKYLLSELRGIPAQLFWKVDEDALYSDLIGDSTQTSLAESAKLEVEEARNINMNTETTTEITTSVPQSVTDSANKEVDYILKISLSPKAIQDAVAQFFLLTPNWQGNKFNREWTQWAVENGVTPAQIEYASKIWNSDKRFNWQQKSLKGIQEHWLELRGGKQSTQPKSDANGSPMSYG